MTGRVHAGEPTLYLFDGYNILHAGGFDGPEQLVDRLADFVASKGVRGIVVFDGAGADHVIGPLEIRYAPHADAAIERIAAEFRDREHVYLVTSDRALRGTSGIRVQKRGARAFLDELDRPREPYTPPTTIADRLDSDTRARLERMRRNED